MTKRNKQGFTLIELVMVMVIVCVVLALAAPSLQGWSRGSHLRDAGDQLLAVARYARSQSIAEARMYRLMVDANAGQYQLLVQDGQGFVELGSDFGRVFTIPSEFRVELTDLAGKPLNFVDFYPTGRTEPARFHVFDGPYSVWAQCGSPTEAFALVTAPEAGR